MTFYGRNDNIEVKMTSSCLSEYTGAKDGGGEEEVGSFSSLTSLLFYSTMILSIYANMYMTHFKIEVRSLCKGVSKILTAYRI